MEVIRMRKINRLTEFDYSQNGAYFVTICTQDMRCLFGQIVGTSENSDGSNVGAEEGVGENVGERIAFPHNVTVIREQRPYMELSNTGKIVHDKIMAISQIYKSVSVSKYVIMPNHIHMIIEIDNDFDESGNAMRSPTISTIMTQFKGAVSKAIGQKFWQKSFHDHIIRNQIDYENIWNYIDVNIDNWYEDEYNKM